MNPTELSIIVALIGLGGVILGSSISIIGQVISGIFDNQKWKKEQKIEILRYNKIDLEKKYKECSRDLQRAIFERSIDINMGTHFLTFPASVKDAFDRAIGDKEPKNNKVNYGKVLFEMKKSLLEFDKSIEKEIN